MGDVKDILGVPRTAGGPGSEPAPAAPKLKQPKVKRPEGMSREAFALLGDFHPIISSQFAGGLKKKDLKAKPKPSTKGIPTWQYKPFRNPARTDGLELMHWTKGYKDLNGRVRDEDGEYYFAKLNKKVQLLRYDNEEYDKIIKPDGSDWSRDETDYLVDLCERFDLRFPVIADRYEYAGGTSRTMEDLKARYYGIARKLLIAREGGEGSVANQVLVKYPYNKQHEQDRKRAIEVLLGRTAKQVQEENAILAEARQIEERRRSESAAALGPSAAAPNGAAAAAPAGVQPTPPGQQPQLQALQQQVLPAQQQQLQPPQPAQLQAAEGEGAGPGAPGTSYGVSSSRSYAGSGFQFPLEFPNDAGPGVPSLFDTNLQPQKPPRPGVYARGAHARAMAEAMQSNIAGGPRALKAIEQMLQDLAWPPAIYGPRTNTRGVCGAWLALRAEVIALQDLKRSLQNRTFADDAAPKHKKGGGTKRK